MAASIEHVEAIDEIHEIHWTLLYTKPHAEAWAELNLRKQGYQTLLPLVATRTGHAPLYPRYLFTGRYQHQPTSSFRGTYGVSRVVWCGDQPARVPVQVIEEIRVRMDAHGVVRLDEKVAARTARESIFSREQRERVRTLEKLAAAGFRVSLMRAS